MIIEIFICNRTYVSYVPYVFVNTHTYTDSYDNQSSNCLTLPHPENIKIISNKLNLISGRRQMHAKVSYNTVCS